MRAGGSKDDVSRITPGGAGIRCRQLGLPGLWMFNDESEPHYEATDRPDPLFGAAQCTVNNLERYHSFADDHGAGRRSRCRSCSPSGDPGGSGYGRTS